MSDKTIRGPELYDMNKQIMDSENGLSKDSIEKKIDRLAEFVDRQGGHYFMLLCREQADYTLFVKSYTQDSLFKFKDDILETLQNRGTILSIGKDSANAYEIWIRDKYNNENFAYYFFPCDSMVVEC